MFCSSMIRWISILCISQSILLQVCSSFSIRTLLPSSVVGSMKVMNGRRDGLVVLNAKRKKKLSMAEKRKRRSKKPPPRPESSSHSKPIDFWGTTNENEEQQEQQVAVKEVEDEAESTKARAAKLVETQRKSIDTLTFVGERIGAIPNYSDLVTPSSDSVLMVDNFLGNANLVQDMAKECDTMFQNGKLTFASVGEYTAQVRGGKDQYNDCPRCVEFVVSLTKNMPTYLNEAADENEWTQIDSSASMASVVVFDRKARSAFNGLVQETSSEEDNDDGIKEEEGEKKSFQLINGGLDTDARKVTAIYFLTPPTWDTSDTKGGGLTLQNSQTIPALNDRLLLFRSDLCYHRMEEWIGLDDDDTTTVASYLVVHLVKTNK